MRKVNEMSLLIFPDLGLKHLLPTSRETTNRTLLPVWSKGREIKFQWKESLKRSTHTSKESYMSVQNNVVSSINSYTLESVETSNHLLIWILHDSWHICHNDDSNCNSFKIAKILAVNSQGFFCLWNPYLYLGFSLF